MTAKELKKEFKSDHKIRKDLDLMISQSNRCSEILKGLSLSPNIDDGFIDFDYTINDYVNKLLFYLN